MNRSASPAISYFWIGALDKIHRLTDDFGREIHTGQFSDMKVALVNDGPVTIIIDSKNRE
jgi:D-Tyr-tRNAtyr deacylase